MDDGRCRDGRRPAGCGRLPLQVLMLFLRCQCLARVAASPAAALPLHGAGTGGDVLAGRAMRPRYPHDLRRYPIGFLFVAIARLIDGELCLDSRRGSGKRAQDGAIPDCALQGGDLPVWLRHAGGGRHGPMRVSARVPLGETRMELACLRGRYPGVAGAVLLFRLAHRAMEHGFS
jgi:hypothetical protein